MQRSAAGVGASVGGGGADVVCGSNVGSVFDTGDAAADGGDGRVGVGGTDYDLSVDEEAPSVEYVGIVRANLTVGKAASLSGVDIQHGRLHGLRRLHRYD